MDKTVRSVSLLVLNLVILGLIFTPAEAFSLKGNPVTWVRQTTGLLVSRVSDVVYYLVQQKKYIFDDYADPNVYPTLQVPVSVEQILAVATSSTVARISKSSKLGPVSTSTLPDVKPVSSAVKTPVPGQVATTVPGLIVKTDPSTEDDNKYVPSDNYAEMVRYTNAERLALALAPLSINQKLNQLAARRVADLFAQQYFEHLSPTGQSAPDLARKVKYDYLLIGENLALGNFADETEIMAAWMASPGHKANIINPRYRELGVAVSTGQFKSERATIAVQIFGEPQTVCAVPNPETKAEIDSSTVVIKKMQTEAIALYGNLTQLKNTPNLDQSYYNQKVQEYNYFARTTNEAVVAMKTMIDFYNSQVAKYNTCLKQ